MTEAWLNEMYSLLMALKTDIGIVTIAYDERLKQYLLAAYKAIVTEGITLDVTDYEDRQLVIMYAAWMWRRRDSGEGMPRMIRYALNNRLFSEKMGDSDDG